MLNQSKMTVTQALDIIHATFVVGRRGRCKHKGGMCAYWTEATPTGCAAGCLMPSNEARKQMEEWVLNVVEPGGLAYKETYNHFIKLAPDCDRLPREFLITIQDWHDGNSSDIFDEAKFADLKEYCKEWTLSE